MSNQSKDHDAYRIKSLTGAAAGADVSVGQTVWLVPDEFNLAHDDSRCTGIEYVAVKSDRQKDFYFTIPMANLEKLT